MASAIAALRVAQAEPGTPNDAIAVLLMALATLTIQWMLVQTTLGIARGELKAHSK